MGSLESDAAFIMDGEGVGIGNIDFVKLLWGTLNEDLVRGRIVDEPTVEDNVVLVDGECDVVVDVDK